MIDAVLWWSGVTAWSFCAVLGLLVLTDWAIPRIADALWGWRLFLRWVREEGRKARSEGPPA